MSSISLVLDVCVLGMAEMEAELHCARKVQGDVCQALHRVCMWWGVSDTAMCRNSQAQGAGEKPSESHGGSQVLKMSVRAHSWDS